ncbi:hypothetical protein [Phytohabitans houttuyneae]|uniref:Uncharacterized protein n=1 Tax=Phytohabitans houttuyneae TaxID=1076126 RepID=A0A6V8KNH9_9ACTN|nr:hypothetical protein [Phytohabitans houttuyneae]GFJ84950.1 hypothetical protein Phou_091300 [Phytohabitans houttuyneae]
MARQARAKFADAPHLLVAIQAIATGPTKAAARAAAADVTSGFGLLSAHFTRRRMRRGAVTAAERWVPAKRMSLASVSEAAALAGLPAEPAAYGLPGQHLAAAFPPVTPSAPPAGRSTAAVERQLRPKWTAT